ncbi:MAG: peptide ABC transporter substrate-binding protein [Phycisphaerales bacterium]|nr:peptide ABC transporter substrate-binding protein [Phycisphaerales bacterium]
MKVLGPILALALLVGVVIALEDERPRADVVFVHGTDLFTVDPQKMSYLHDLRMARAIYEPLIALSAEGDLVPAAAESWEVSDDGLSYTFHLRPNLRFSNGDPVTARDFFYAWRRAILPDTAARYSGLFFHIAGAKPFFKWRAAVLGLRTGGDYQAEVFEPGEADRLAGLSAEALLQQTYDRFDEQVGLKVIDDHTLQVQLEQPLPYFLDLVGFGTYSPVHSKSVKAATSVEPRSGRIKEDPAWLKPGVLVSNGPYVLDRWRYKRDVRLERNPNYWNADAILNRSIEAVVIEDPNTAILAFESGEVDWLPDVLADYRADMIAQRAAYEERHRLAIDNALAGGADIDEVLADLPEPQANERRNVHILDTFGTDYFQVNCRPKLPDGRANPLADAGVRRALALAVDKTSIVERVTRLRERVSGSMVPENSIPGYEPPAGLPFDPERARQELVEAGWTRQDNSLVNEAGETFPTIVILYSTGTPRYEDVSLAIRDMWRRELGLAVEVEGRAGNEYRAKVETGAFMVARGGWYGDYGDPTTFLDLNRTGDGNNHRGFSNAEYDGLLRAAELERDPEKRMRILAEAERVLVEEQLPVIPICTYAQLYMYEPGKFTGLTHHPRLEQYLQRLKTSRTTP